MSQDYSFEDLKNLFCADLGEKVKSLEAAVSTGNWETVGRISHQIKGTAKSFGFAEISYLAAELEQSAAQKKPEYSADLVRKISDRSVL